MRRELPSGLDEQLFALPGESDLSRLAVRGRSDFGGLGNVRVPDLTIRGFDQTIRRTDDPYGPRSDRQNVHFTHKIVSFL